MSFRLFIYYCALCGGCAAYLGWVLGKLATARSPVTQAGIKGLLLGMVLGLALAVVDALWNFSRARALSALLRVLVCGVVGCIAGFFGGLIGQALYGWRQVSLFLVFGWTLTGLLIGASLGAFDLFSRLLHEEDLRGARRKMVNGVIGGSLGGLLGGTLFLLIRGAWGMVFRNQPLDEFWSPGAWGFVALGLCIGLLIGLAQVILMEAWVKVEAGFRPGRELILSGAEVTIGRSEGCDIGLFGDSGVERTHAYILQRGGRYLLADAGTPGGTYLNGRRIGEEPTPLRSGDEIRVGRNTLRFGARRKRVQT